MKQDVDSIALNVAHFIKWDAFPCIDRSESKKTYLGQGAKILHASSNTVEL